MDRDSKRRIREARQTIIRRTRQSSGLSRREPLVELIPLEAGSGPGITASTAPSSDLPIDGMCGQWIERGSSNQAGRMLTADALGYGTILAASDGGVIWSGSRAGGDWQSLNDHHAFNDVTMIRVVSSQAGDRLLVVDSDGLHRSDDHGLTWKSRFFSYSVVNGLVREGDQSVYVAVNEWNYQHSQSELVVYRSTDLGATIDPVASVLAERASTIFTPSVSTPTASVYFLADETMYRLDAENAIETLGSLPLPDGSVHQTHSDRQALLAGAEISGEITLYVALPLAVPATGGGWDIGTTFFASDDGGYSWELRSFLESQPFGQNSFACSNVDPTQVYFGAACELMSRSEDAAFTWIEPDYGWYEYYSDYRNKLHCDISGINVFSDGDGDHEYLLIHTDGGTYESVDSGRTVTNLSLAGLRCSQYYSTYSHQSDPSLLYAGSQDQGFQRTASLQDHHVWDFEQLVTGDDANIVSSDGGETLWWVDPARLLYMPRAPTANGAFVFRYSTILGSAFWLPPLMADPEDPDRVILGGGSPHGSTTGGMLSNLFWIKIGEGGFSWGQEPFEFRGVVTALAHSTIDTDHRYVMTDGARFYHSPDQGQSWTESADGGLGITQFGAAIVACPRQLGRVYIAGSGYGGGPVRVSNDHGMSFEDFSTGLPNTLVNKLAISPEGDFLFAATEVGPYVASTESGAWQYMGGVRAPDQAYTSVEYLEAVDTVRFATYGRGIWDFEIRECPIQVRRGQGRVAP